MKSSDRDRNALNGVAAALTQAIAHRDLPAFWRAFRASELPYIGGAHDRDPVGLVRRCVPILHRLGAISPAAALAAENHYYVSSAIATFPCRHEGLDRKRRQLCNALFRDRRLVANTNSRIHGAKLGRIGTQVRRDGAGFQITGTASYTSLATEGDLLVVMSEIESEGPAVFVVSPMQNNPGIEIGPYLFPRAMIDSDTRKLTFRDLTLAADSLLVSREDGALALALFAFEMAWHQILIPALYLGAAAQALEEVRLFMRATRDRDDRPLSEVDGVVAEVGRLSIAYQAACAIVHQAGEALGDIHELPRDQAALERAVDLAGAAKYAGTRCAEDTVAAARRLIGARVFTGDHRIEQLTQEVIFGVLGPEVTSVIERRHGRRVLGERSVLDPE
jgi:alkylation response protein AidB-like acyl-CoA dehydrogenase